MMSLMLLTATLNAHAVTTMGDRSCGNWIKSKEDKQQSNGTQWMLEATNHTWLAGYLSGLSVAMNKDFLKTVDGDSIFLWVDNYCRENPLKTVADAAMNLMFELTKK